MKAILWQESHGHFMATVADLVQLGRERLHGVTRDKPGCLDAVLVQHLQDTIGSDSGSKNAS